MMMPLQCPATDDVLLRNSRRRYDNSIKYESTDINFNEKRERGKVEKRAKIESVMSIIV